MSKDTAAADSTLAIPDPIVAQPKGIPQDVVRLCMLPDTLTPAEEFSRTARYASNPNHYLQELLGLNAFNSRKHLLSLPTHVTKDIYGHGEYKQHFEMHIANLFGKSDGLFFISGIQAQLAAVKIHCERAGRPIAAWHATSHLEGAEEKSYATLYHLRRVLLGNHPDRLPTVEEVQSVLNLPIEKRPAVVVLELPNRVLGAQTHSFADLSQISDLCRHAGVKLHLDGARIWEIEPYYSHTSSKSFADIAALFDSVYVSFYKGLRGAAGAMLLSSTPNLISEARVWQQRAGGRCVTLSYFVTDCERGFNENIGTFARKWRMMDEIVEAVKSATAKFKTPGGKNIVGFIPDRAMCSQIHTLFTGFTQERLWEARDAVEERTGVRVFEWIKPRGEFYSREATVVKDEEEQEESTGQDMGNKEGGGDVEQVEESRKEFVMEWQITPLNEGVERRVFVGGYVALCEELVKGQGQEQKISSGR